MVMDKDVFFARIHRKNPQRIAWIQNPVLKDLQKAKNGEQGKCFSL